MTVDRYATGFVAGLTTAIEICLDEAERSDRRTPVERIAKHKPNETTRRLRQVVSRIRERVNDQEPPHGD